MLMLQLDPLLMHPSIKLGLVDREGPAIVLEPRRFILEVAVVRCSYVIAHAILFDCKAKNIRTEVEFTKVTKNIIQQEQINRLVKKRKVTKFATTGSCDIENSQIPARSQVQ